VRTLAGFAEGGDRALAVRTFSRTLHRRALEANVLGGTLAFLYLGFISPPQPEPPPHERVFLLTVPPLYLVLALGVGYLAFRRSLKPVKRWLAAGRAARREERVLVFRLPWVMAARAAAGWLGAVVLFGGITATHHPAIYVAGLVVGIALAGLTTTAVTYLVAERTLRPVFAAALAGTSDPGPVSSGATALGTRPRLLVSWALGSGVALIAVALAFLGRGDSTGDDLIGPVLFLVMAGLLAGGVLTVAAARSISDPIQRVSEAIRRVEQGSLDEEVVVDDGGEIGLLQAGFNRMVAGLRERDRIRATFGTYVDHEIAEHILREGIALEGEEVEVTLLFLDVRGFTSLAERLSAGEVVATLNRLFERIVPIIHAHGGHVDKYVGDGLLAVFGAPRRQADHADEALAAGMEIVAAVEQEFGTGLSVGVGLNSGTVVAGNVGGAGRLEFSVIGDAVNTAARVEAATRETGDLILVAQRTRELLRHEGVQLEERPGVELKGKREPVALYAPGGRADRH
jgi:adenylate cyclase